MSPKGSRNEREERRIRAIPHIAIIVALATVSIVLYVTDASAVSPAKQTHMGKTAQSWHSELVAQRRALTKQAGNLGDKVRQLRAVLKQSLKPYTTRPPHYAQWICIHGGEGAWKSNTGNGYYGGLQMDMQFQRTYGWDLLQRKGTANNWTPLEQMWVAEKAHASGRGFYPWPTTARRCGLI